MARVENTWEWAKALPWRVFDGIVNWTERVYDKYGRFVLRTWQRGGWWRLLAVALVPVQVVAWLVLWTGGFIIYGALMVLAFAFYMAIVFAMFIPLAAAGAALYGALLLVGLHPGASSSSGESATEPAGFCATHDCIPSFYEGRGYPVECVDGTWSDSGGIQGACSYHDGER